jgi:serine/threonine-protein kinase
MDIYYRKEERVKGYTIKKVLGEGRYGIVYLAVDNYGNNVVIKQLKNNMLQKTRSKLYYERKILRYLDEPNFPKFIGKFKDKYRECYVMEYIDGKTFFELLSKDRYEFSKEEIYEVCEAILNLLEILHSNGIVHRDIRTPNVIIRENNEIALIDFGLARYVDNDLYDETNDYWYLGDFLIHLYYSSFIPDDNEEKPWYKELDLNSAEKHFLKRLMGIEDEYESLHEIREDLEVLKKINKGNN